MPDPRIEETPLGRVYFYDAEGTAWRVHDATFSRGKWTTMRPPNGAATRRVFVAKDGAKRVTPFAPSEDRRLFPDLLAAQLQRSSYLGERYDASERGPR